MSEPSMFDFIEMDRDVSPAPAEEPQARAIELDMTVPGQTRCADCGDLGPVSDSGKCRACSGAAVEADLAADLGALAAVAGNAAANAASGNLGDLAVGRSTLGVGFTSAEGYLEALRRGVKKSTRDEYVRILRDQYGAAVDFEVPLIGDGPLPVGPGIVHEPSGTGPSFEEQVAAGRARAAAAKLAAQGEVQARSDHDGLAVVPGATEETHRATRLTHGDVVAGAVAEGNGILTHWTGQGPLTLGKLAELGAAAGLDAAWLPKAKEAKTQANLAIQEVASRAGLAVIRERRGKLDADLAYDARWRLLDPTVVGAAGDAAGTIALVVTLDDDQLTFDAATDVADQISATFADLTSREVLQAGHVTGWLGSLIRDRLSGVKYGGCWYVPRSARPIAEAIVSTFSTSWGSDWMSPPTPIATSAQLGRGIANGLAAEVDETLADLAKAGAKCEAGHVGEQAATTYLKKFAAHAARVKAFEELLGSALVAESKAKVEAACGKLDGILSDGMGGAKRFQLLWEEVERDLKAGGAS